MKKFIIEDTFACWVTFTSTVEAATEDEALQAYGEGYIAAEYKDPYIGDSIDGFIVGPKVAGIVPPDNVVSKPMKRKGIKVKT